MSGNVRSYVEYFFRLSTPDPTAVGEDEIVEYVRAYSRPEALRAGFAYYRAFGEDAHPTPVRVGAPADLGAAGADRLGLGEPEECATGIIWPQPACAGV